MDEELLEGQGQNEGNSGNEEPTQGSEVTQQEPAEPVDENQEVEVGPVQESSDVPVYARYTANAFNKDEALNHQLCALFDENNNKIIGTGIVTNRKTGQVDITVEGVKYTFDFYGNPVSKNAIDANYVLKMATSQETPSGSDVSSTTNVYTRSIDDNGNITYTADSQAPEADITIDALNARDQFAIQALRGMLDKIEDPSALGKNEITHYCESAYQWASYMMEMSGKTRAVMKDSQDSHGSQGEVTVFENNTEKLLDNIKVAVNNVKTSLEKTDAETGQNEYSERIINPTLNTLITQYIKDGNSTVGLKDLISAIGNISLQVDLSDVVTALDSLTTVNIGDQGLGRDASHPIYISGNGGGGGGGGSSTITVTSMPSLGGTFAIGDLGLGCDSQHPFYISGGSFPSKQSLAAEITANNIDSMIAFNAAGAVGYSSKAQVQMALLENLYYIRTTETFFLSLDTRIKAWLDATTIVSDGQGGWKLNVPNNI